MPLVSIGVMSNQSGQEYIGVKRHMNSLHKSHCFCTVLVYYPLWKKLLRSINDTVQCFSSALICTTYCFYDIIKA